MRVQGMIFSDLIITDSTLKEAGSTDSNNQEGELSKFQRSHMAWNMAGLCFNHCTISLSSVELFITESNIGLPKNLGLLLNDHIRSFGQALCGCFSCINTAPDDQSQLT